MSHTMSHIVHESLYHYTDQLTLILFSLSLQSNSPWPCSFFESEIRVQRPDYRELNFQWQRSLHQTGILILHCPIFYLWLTFFSRNCLVVLFIHKADHSCFLRLTHVMSTLKINHIDFNINLMENLNNFLL